MPWRYREYRLLSLSRVRRTVGFGEPLPLGAGARDEERLTPAFDAHSGDDCHKSACVHDLHALSAEGARSRLAPVRVGSEGEMGTVGVVASPKVLSNSQVSRSDRESGYRATMCHHRSRHALWPSKLGVSTVTETGVSTVY